MKCSEAKPLLEEYLDGELGEYIASELHLHLQACKECASEFTVLRAEGDLYQAYQENVHRGLSVDSGMWARVQAGIELRKYKFPAAEKIGWFLMSLGDFFAAMLPGQQHLRQALAAVLLVIISVGATLVGVHYYRTGEQDRSSSMARAGMSGERSLESAMQSIRRAEQEYLDAIHILSDMVEKRKPSLDRRLIAELESNMRSIDESITATRKAYLAHPSDPELALYMLAAYSKKVELLQELSSL